jgi:hypothetical protein
MRTLSKFLAASAGVLSLAAAGAASATVFISFDGVNTVATFADGVYAFNANCGVVNCGNFDAVQVSGDTGALPTLLHSQNVDATTSAGAAADITVWVTRTNITSPNFDHFRSSFTSNNSSDANAVTPFTVTMSTFVDPTNGLYDGNLMSTFSTSDAGASASNKIAAGSTGGGTYSVTEKYVIDATAFATSESSSPSIVFSGLGTAVPEPSTWALMILGFGGAGAMARSRRRQAVATA